MKEDGLINQLLEAASLGEEEDCDEETKVLREKLGAQIKELEDELEKMRKRKLFINAPVICMPLPLGRGYEDIAGLKCRDSIYDVSLQCRGCARILISPKIGHYSKVILTAHLNIYLYTYVNINPKSATVRLFDKGCKLISLIVLC